MVPFTQSLCSVLVAGCEDTHGGSGRVLVDQDRGGEAPGGSRSMRGTHSNNNDDSVSSQFLKTDHMPDAVLYFSHASAHVIITVLGGR